MRSKQIVLKVLFMLAIALPMSGTGQTAPSTGEQAGKIAWTQNYAQAVAEAKKSNKPIILFFTGSNWCGWCKKMDSEIFSSPEFIREAGPRFVFVELDYPTNSKLPDEIAAQNAALKKKHGITGFPTLIILDPNENFIAETGYKAGGGAQFAQYLKGLLQK